MKKYIYFTLLSVLLLSSCENFLDTESYTKKNTGNFPETSEDIDMMLNAIYVTLNHMAGQKGSPHPNTSHFYTAEIASDDRFGGGGIADKNFQMADKLMNYTPSFFEPFWQASYEGIFRANMLLESIDKTTGWDSEDNKKQTAGETYFMRALLYFQLAQLFNEVPMPLTSEAKNLPQSSASELYAQIASDLKTAIETMPAKTYDPTFSGHATKYAAEAFMARVFLFYTGYYKQEALPLPAEGSISKSQVVSWLEDCRDHSGYGLVNDFRNLWPYTNEYTTEDYTYTRGKGLLWERDHNKEAIFAVKFNNLAGWTDVGFSNTYVLFFGLRGANGSFGTFPFGQGWGCGPVNTRFYEQWGEEEPNDIRRKASILNINDPEEGITEYAWGEAEQVEETGYWQKKYFPIRAKKTDGNLTLYSTLMYGTQDNFQLGHTQDLVLMRYADVLLMHSELTGTPEGMNAVRNRAGLPSIEYSLENLKKERRHELAFEGLRWFDLMRWGDAADALAKQAGVEICNQGKWTIMKEFGSGYRDRYEKTGGFWPIPQTQIDLSNGVLEQNKGWGTADVDYPGWNN